jgi:hypothetical protein
MSKTFLHYPPELEVKETTNTPSSASFLNLYLEFDDSGQISTKIYDKRDDFNPPKPKISLRNALNKTWARIDP